MNTQREKFDAFMKLAEFGALQHDRKREFEWKVTFGVWGLLVGVMLFQLNELPHYSWLAPYIPYATFLGLCLYVLVFVRRFRIDNAADMRLSTFYRQAAEALVRDPHYIAPERETNFMWLPLDCNLRDTAYRAARLKAGAAPAKVIA
jgi:hypothetical protein